MAPTPRPSRTGRPWQRTKQRVIRRDNGICHLCGQPGADSADHIIPVSHGGAIYDLNNLRAVHHRNGPRCNMRRGNRSIEQARTDIARTITGDHDWTW